MSIEPPNIETYITFAPSHGYKPITFTRSQPSYDFQPTQTKGILLHSSIKSS